MPFLTAEQVLAMRNRGADTIKLDGIDKSIKVLRAGASKALDMAQLQADQREAKNVGPAAQRALFLFMLEQFCSSTDGTPLTREDAEQLFTVLDLTEVTDICNRITASITPKKSALPSEASPGAALPIGSADSSAGPTPTTSSNS